MSKNINKTNAMRLLDNEKVDYTVVEYAHEKDDPVDGIHVANLLGEPCEQVFKTLVAQANTKEYLVYMIPVDQELDLGKCAKAAGVKKVNLIHMKELLPLTGYIRGGCSPLGQKKKFRTFIDETSVLFDTIYFSAGKIGMQICIDPAKLSLFLDISAHDLVRD
jgi:Cys-tRNA(Pro)/Cys-tRNA(Cys) deacylase